MKDPIPQVPVAAYWVGHCLVVNDFSVGKEGMGWGNLDVEDPCPLDDRFPDLGGFRPAFVSMDWVLASRQKVSHLPEAGSNGSSN